MKPRSTPFESGEKIALFRSNRVAFLRSDLLVIHGAFRVFSLIAFTIALFFSGAVRAQTTNYWKTSGGGVWSTTSNWSLGTAPSSTSLVVFNTNTLNGAETITLSGTASALGLVFSNTGTTTLKSSSTTTNTLNLFASGILVNSGAGAVTIGNTSSNVNLILNAAQGWTNNSANTLTIAGGVSGAFNLALGGTGNIAISGVIGSGALSITKNGTGTTILTGTNTYTGTTTISGGTLSLSTNGAITASTNIVVNSGGTLLLGGSNQLTTNSALTLGGGTLSLGGGATRAGTNALSTLTLTANSVINFSALSGNSVLNFSDILGLGSFTLTILNWNGTTEWGTTVGTATTKLLVNTSLSNSQLANISFYSGGTTNSGFLGTGVFSGSQIIPVPEASVVLSALLLLGWLICAYSLPVSRIAACHWLLPFSWAKVRGSTQKRSQNQCCFNRRSDSGRSLD
jgi:autotransporter-associated beta strand protein